MKNGHLSGNCLLSIKTYIYLGAAYIHERICDYFSKQSNIRLNAKSG